MCDGSHSAIRYGHINGFNDNSIKRRMSCAARTQTHTQSTEYIFFLFQTRWTLKSSRSTVDTSFISTENALKQFAVCLFCRNENENKTSCNVFGVRYLATYFQCTKLAVLPMAHWNIETNEYRGIMLQIALHQQIFCNAFKISATASQRWPNSRIL